MSQWWTQGKKDAGRRLRVTLPCSLRWLRPITHQMTTVRSDEFPGRDRRLLRGATPLRLTVCPSPVRGMVDGHCKQIAPKRLR